MSQELQEASLILVFCCFECGESIQAHVAPYKTEPGEEKPLEVICPHCGESNFIKPVLGEEKI